MLLALLDYIKKEKLVSSRQLAREFQVDETALEPMLNIWVQKGAIKQCLNQSQCKSSCMQCKSPPRYYQIN